MLFINIGLNLFAVIMILDRISAESRGITSNNTRSSVLPVIDESRQAEKLSFLDLLLAQNEYIYGQGSTPSRFRTTTSSLTYRRSTTGSSPSRIRSSTSWPDYRWSTIGSSPSGFRTTTSSPNYRWSTTGSPPGRIRSSASSPEYKWSTRGSSSSWFRSTTSSPKYRWSTTGSSPSRIRSSTSSPDYRWSTRGSSPSWSRTTTSSPNYRWSSTGSSPSRFRTSTSSSDDRWILLASCRTDRDCLNGGTCRYAIHEYLCDCPPNFSGSNCEVNLCSNLEKNCLAMGANCKFNGYIPVCECPPGKAYRRKTVMCEDICDSRTCANGICEVVGRRYQCKCDEGFTGSRCTVRTDPDPIFSGVLMGITVLGIVLVTLLFGTCVFVCHQRRKNL